MIRDIVECIGYFIYNIEMEKKPEKHIILASNLPRDISQKEVTEYFSDRKRSGGGPIVKMKLTQIAKRAFIRFKDRGGKILDKS